VISFETSNNSVINVRHSRCSLQYCVQTWKHLTRTHILDTPMDFLFIFCSYVNVLDGMIIILLNMISDITTT